MLGDILGRRAGDATTELLALFFGPRAAICGVFLEFPLVPLAPFKASICGLWLADVVTMGRANAGEGREWKPGVLAPLEVRVGVVWPSDWVSILERGGLLTAVAASGRLNSSISMS